MTDPDTERVNTLALRFSYALLLVPDHRDATRRLMKAEWGTLGGRVLLAVENNLLATIDALIEALPDDTRLMFMNSARELYRLALAKDTTDD